MCVTCAYLAVQFFHSNEVQGLEGVSCRGNEIKADVDPGVVVVKQRAFDLQLFLEIVFKLSVNVVNNGFVTVERGREKRETVRIYVCGSKLNICLLIHALVMNMKRERGLFTGKGKGTDMFSVTV